jgi:hypothetical protein
VTTEPGFNERRKAQWLSWIPLVTVLAGWLLTWGATLQRVDSAEREIAKHANEILDIKRDYVTGREFKAINDRLVRIESGMDELTRYFRRPQP